MKKLVTMLCVAAMIVTLSGCGGNPSDAGADVTQTPSTSEQSADSNAETTDTAEADTAERPEVLKEGIVTRKASYYHSTDGDVLGCEELYNNDGKIVKITMDEVYGDNMPHYLSLPAYVGVTEYEYDGNGNLIKETWNGMTESTVKEYDANGLLIGSKHKYTDHSEYDEDRTYSYEKDAEGNPVKGYYINNLVDNSGAYEYDDAGNIISGTFDARHMIYELEYANGVKTKETEYVRWAGKTEDAVGHVSEYDSNGNKIHFTDYDEDGNVRTEYQDEFDSDGKLKTHTYLVLDGQQTNSGLEYVYDAEGSCINNLVVNNGVVEDQNADDRYEYEYDENGNVSKATRFMRGDTNALTYTVYEYLY